MDNCSVQFYNLSESSEATANSSQFRTSTRSPEACEGPPWPLEEPRIGMAARLMKSDAFSSACLGLGFWGFLHSIILAVTEAESQRGESGNLLRALHSGILVWVHNLSNS